MNALNKFAAAVAMTATLTSASGCLGIKKGWKGMGKETCTDVVKDVTDTIDDIADELDDADREDCLDAQVGLAKIREIKNNATIKCRDALNESYLLGAVERVTRDFTSTCGEYVDVEPVQSKPLNK